MTVHDDWRPGWRPRALGLVARVMGPGAVLPILSALERGDAEMYVGQADAQDLIKEEEHSAASSPLSLKGSRPKRSRARWPPDRPGRRRRTSGRRTRPCARAAGRRRAARRRPPAATRVPRRWSPPSPSASNGTRAVGCNSGTLRAAVFGVNDGLVSNLSLVMGVAGADPGNQFVLLAGVAGLLAGAFSMAAGEYVSMQSQRELFERQIELERDELEESPEEERASWR